MIRNVINILRGVGRVEMVDGKWVKSVLWAERVLREDEKWDVYWRRGVGGCRWR